MLTDGQKITLGNGIFTADEKAITHFHTEKIKTNCHTSAITTIRNNYIMSYTYTTKDYD